MTNLKMRWNFSATIIEYNKTFRSYIFIIFAKVRSKLAICIHSFSFFFLQRIMYKIAGLEYQIHSATKK